LPIGNGMNDGTPEPRTPVMIMVEASWADQNGTVHNTRARIENKSAGGACIRLNTQIAVGTKLRVYGRWDKFSGEARYCREDGREYLVGILKDKGERPLGQQSAAKQDAAKEVTSEDVAAAVMVEIGSVTRPEESETVEIVLEVPKVESAPIANIAELVTALTSDEAARETLSQQTRIGAQPQGFEGLEKRDEQRQQASARKEPGKERKHMRRKWFEMGHKDEQLEGSNGTGNDKEAVLNHAPATIVSMETLSAETEREEGPNVQVELLSMEDIYRMAGILNPRKGYSINKIVEMLRSEHLRGLSREMKRASVLMALDAAGITVDEVLQDAKARQDAIDSYETDQRKQFEAQLARKAEENVQIQAELERVKARYTERLRRNLDGMAREKATFGNWLTLKQQEGQSMAEAVELCLKPPAVEKPKTELEEVSLAGARVKPV
jgi:hypothetical protein